MGSGQHPAQTHPGETRLPWPQTRPLRWARVGTALHGERRGGRSPAASSDPLTTSRPPHEAALPARCVPRELRTGLPPPWDCDGWKCRLMVKSWFPAGLPNWQHLQTGSTFRRQDAGPAMGRGMRLEGDSITSWAVVPGLPRVTLSHAVPRAALPPCSVPRLLVKVFPGPRSLGLRAWASTKACPLGRATARASQPACHRQALTRCTQAPTPAMAQP